ncbi:beta strand repeat-containing protein [Palleronia sp. KMU-117]|uniref:beta strand repeat-containing protein n=1 Tax=Palleronia sp. KMU-117 TaxID=3434108 RepID=UPI003D749EE1
MAFITGNDNPNLLNGTTSDDIILALGGNDTVFAGTGNDSVDGGDGNDVVYGGGGADTIVGGTGADLLFGEADNDSILGDIGNDTVNGGGGEDILRGGAGSDSIDGGDDDDALFGDDGIDTLVGGLGADRLFGGTGNDLLIGDANDEYLYGGIGSDIIEIRFSGSAAFQPGSIISGIDGATETPGAVDTLKLSPLTTVSAYIDLRLAEIVSIERLEIADPSGAVAFFYAEFNAQQFGSGLSNSLFVNSEIGNATILINMNGATSLLLNAWTFGPSWGNSTQVIEVRGGAGNDSLVGSSQKDHLFGEGGHDTLRGGGGHDALQGGGGNDVLDGGTGNDLLLGGDGNDNLSGGAGNDHLRGNNGDDILSDTDTEHSSSEFSGDAGTDTLVIANAVGAQFQGALVRSIERLQFSQAIANDRIAQFEAQQFDGGYGSFTTTNGLAANLHVIGAAFTQTSREIVLVTMTSANPDRTVTEFSAAGFTFETWGGQGEYVQIDGTPMRDRIEGSSGADLLRGFGSRDTLIGGAGADTLDGGDSSEDVADYSASNAGVTMAAPGTITGGHATGDVLIGIENFIGSNFDDVLRLGATGRDLVGNAGNDNLIGNDLENDFIGGAGADTLNGGGGLDLADYSGSDAGVTMSAVGVITGGHATGDVLISIENFIGSAFNDVLRSGPENNLVLALAGDDQVFGGGGNDVLAGGDGNDTLWGEDGNDALEANAGIDALYGGSGDDSLNIESGIPIGAVYDGGAGNDRLLVKFNGIFAYLQFATITGIESLIYNPLIDSGLNITFEASQFVGNHGNLTVTSGLSETLQITGANAGAFVDSLWINMERTSGPPATTPSVTNFSAAGFTFSNWGAEDVVRIEGTAANNLITGSSQYDQLLGGGGNDTLRGGAGNDRVEGGAGNDLLFGGSGNDSLLGGINQDTLYGDAGNDTLDGGENSDRYFLSDALDLLNDTGTVGYDEAFITSVTGVNFNAFVMKGIERVNGFDGNDTLNAQTASTAWVLSGENGDDLLAASPHGDTLLGGAGNDVLLGGDGNDQMLGGTGNDSFYGGNGDDTFFIGESGDFVGNGNAGFDKAQINNAAGVSIAIGTWLGVERVNGFTGNDAIDATGYAWTLILDGRGGNDTLIGGSANDLFYAGDGNDSVFGGAGNDALIGDAGNDSLNGGAGDDFLLGLGGADVFVFDDAWGKDVVKDFTDGVDRLNFALHSGVNALSDLVIQQSGANTRITLATPGADVLTLADFDAADLSAADFQFA